MLYSQNFQYNFVNYINDFIVFDVGDKQKVKRFEDIRIVVS